MYAFFVLCFILIIIYGVTTTQDGFQDAPSHNVTIPKIPSPDLSNDVSKVNPSNLPGKLPIAPYEQIAAMSPLPYQDTTLIKANRQQIVSLVETLKGFLAFEAQELAERSDPSIQLPLQTAKSDFHTLQSQVEVLNRNPGIQSTVTLAHLNEISSNLAYLQEQVRLSGSAGTIQHPIEGFQAGQVATIENLKDFIGRIQGEIHLLSASGTNDPIMAKRVAALTQMKSEIQTIVNQVESGIMAAVEIPIMKNDIDKALPVLSKPSEPLPQLIKSLHLPTGLANALPTNLQKDPAITKQIGTLLDKYADQIINGISASFSVKYTSPNEASIGHQVSQGVQGHKYDEPQNVMARTSTITKTGFPSIADLNNVTNAKFTPSDLGVPVTDHLAPKPMDAGRGPSHFDWKQRVKEIEDQVKRRGLNPTDFGIMTKDAKVSNEFSWKGYANMICKRLQATMDPGLPETCGCPPMDWKGWRNAK